MGTGAKVGTRRAAGWRAPHHLAARRRLGGQNRERLNHVRVLAHLRENLIQLIGAERLATAARLRQVAHQKWPHPTHAAFEIAAYVDQSLLHIPCHRVGFGFEGRLHGATRGPIRKKHDCR